MFRSLAIAFAFTAVSMPASAESGQYLLAQQAQPTHSAAEPEWLTRARNGGSGAVVHQNGNNLSAEIRQSGPGHNAVIAQQGRDHQAAIAQTGRNNGFVVVQMGVGGDANINQNGANKDGYLFQHTGKDGSRYEYRW